MNYPYKNCICSKGSSQSDHKRFSSSQSFLFLSCFLRRFPFCIASFNELLKKEFQYSALRFLLEITFLNLPFLSNILTSLNMVNSKIKDDLGDVQPDLTL